MDYTQLKNKRRKLVQRSPVKRVKNSIGVLVFRVAMAVVLIAGFGVAGAGIGIYLGILRNAPLMSPHLIPEGRTSFIISAHTGEEITRLYGEQNRVFVPTSQMPQHLMDAFVAIEDERFHSHNGIDFRSMVRALQRNLTTDGPTEGASTITQQLIKNSLGKTANTMITKLQEQYLAVQYERHLAERLGSVEAAKDYILEQYLNTINLGRGYHGVQAAAYGYFGKDVSELTISESAVIAAITRNPSRYQPFARPEINRGRQILVLNKMLELGMISEREHREAMNDPVHDRIRPGAVRADGTRETPHSWFTDALLRQIARDLQVLHHMTAEMAFHLIYNGGLRIYSTQNTQIQEIVDDVFLDESFFPNHFEIDIDFFLTTHNSITGRYHHHRHSGRVSRRDQIEPWLDRVRNELLTANDTVISRGHTLTPQPQAAFVLMDQHNGQVLAIAGGRGEKQGSLMLCRATTSLRSPGSQFKVLAAFAPGIDMGVLTAATHIPDEPFTVTDPWGSVYTPVNWWGASWEGLRSVRRAVYRSMNVVSVRAFWENVGPEAAFNYLTNFGFTSLEGTLPNGSTFRDVGAAVPLGGLTLGVSQIEMTAAYAAIANLGVYHPPILYTVVYDHEGNVLLENRPNPHRVMRAPAAYVVTDMMRDTVRGVAGATGGTANMRNTRIPTAGKTGTSQWVHDLGFTGYTPFFTAGIWLGYDQPQTMRGLDSVHLQMWRAIMERVHTELELPEIGFERPEGVVSGTICRDSGMLTTDLCHRDPRGGRGVSDVFVLGTLPTGHCTVHQEIVMNTHTGMRASPNCPAWQLELTVVAVRPFVDAEGNFNDGLPPICRYHDDWLFEEFSDLASTPPTTPGGLPWWGLEPEEPTGLPWTQDDLDPWGPQGLPGFQLPAPALPEPALPEPEWPSLPDIHLPETPVFEPEPPAGMPNITPPPIGLPTDTAPLSALEDWINAFEGW